VSAVLSEYDVERRPLLASGRAEPKYCIIDDTRLGLVLIRRRLVSTRLEQITWTPPVNTSREQQYHNNMQLTASQINMQWQTDTTL